MTFVSWDSCDDTIDGHLRTPPARIAAFPRIAKTVEIPANIARPEVGVSLLGGLLTNAIEEMLRA